MKISYLVTSHNETDTLHRLLSTLFNVVKKTNDEIIILDDFSTEKFTNDIIQDFMALEVGDMCTIKKYQHKLNNDYGSHKNFGIEKCTGDFIFQIDGDELPPESLLGDNLKEFLSLNKDTELYWIARINHFIGVTPEDAKQWGWKLSKSLSLKDTTIVNYPDFQGRIFKRDYPRIKWECRLHEKITGFLRYSILPIDEEYAMLHTKTIEKQRETNIRYNKDFTDSENRGHRPS